MSTTRVLTLADILILAELERGPRIPRTLARSLSRSTVYRRLVALEELGCLTRSSESARRTITALGLRRLRAVREAFLAPLTR